MTIDLTLSARESLMSCKVSLANYGVWGYRNRGKSQLTSEMACRLAVLQAGKVDIGNPVDFEVFAFAG
jgi:hypothetical protein